MPPGGISAERGRIMALKIYGVARSRTFRTLWMAKELGLDYEHIKVDFATGGTRTPAHLALNPTGRIPVIDDDGFVLWESMAINLYLAKKHSIGRLYPTRLEDEARAWQWSFWGLTEVERPVLTALFNRVILPEDKRDAASADEAERMLGQPLEVLDGALGGSSNLLGSHFTVADLNVASILAWTRPAQIDMGPFPKVADWAKNCAERPAARAARQLQRE
jgi:glutathione S-transferase